MTTKSGVVHFTIGENMGIRLMEIANEHLTIGNDPVKALKAITDSLIGVSTDLALKILKGDIVLFVDVDTQEIIATERDPEIHEKIFPKVDVIFYMEKRSNEIEKLSMSLISSWKILQNSITKNRGKFTIDFDYDDIFRYIAGDNEGLFDELKYDREIEGIETLVSTTKMFIERTTKVQNVMEWMYHTWDDFGKGYKGVHSYIDYKGRIDDSLIDVTSIMKETLNSEFMVELEDDSITKYLDAVHEIDEVIANGIEPVDIMDNYSAGWLSPDGVFYALNGEIANMLHNQIADALVKNSIIPKTDEDNFPVQPDGWLEENGWVKVHDNNINFAGCLNNRTGREKPNLNMTDTQIDMIYRYIQLLHGGVVRCGWKMVKISAARFQMMSKADPFAFNNMYFNF